MSFWEKYEALCKEKGLSPSGSEMVNVLGVSSAGITYWKQNKSAPKNYEIYQKLSEFFNVDIRYLLGMTESMYGEDIIEDMTDKMIDCGVDIAPFDNETGTGKEYAVLYNNKSFDYQEHEFKEICMRLHKLIRDTEIYTVDKFCRETFGDETFSDLSRISIHTQEEEEFLKNYRKLSFEGKTMVNAKLIEELRRQE